MAVDPGPHPNPNQLEQYALGTLSEAEITPLEQHLLLCAVCQERLAETEACLQALQAEAREIRRAQRAGTETGPEAEE